VFGFLGTVFCFEYQLKPKPTAIAVFSDEVWRLQQTILETERNLASLQNEKSVSTKVKAVGFQNNTSGLSESFKLASGHLDELAKSIYENQDKLITSHLNEKRILLVFSGLFVAYLVKLFSGLYKYNAYLKAHYVTALDALDLSMVGGEGNDKIDMTRFKDLLAALSVKHLLIDQGGSLFEGLLSKKGRPSWVTFQSSVP
jgi:hypothetical protein